MANHERRVGTSQLPGADLLRSILDNAFDAIVTIDSSGLIETFNRAAAETFGYAASDVIGRNVSVLMPEPHRSQHDAYIRHYLDTGEARIIGIGRVVQARRKDGSTFPISLAVTEFSESDGHRHFVGIIHDVTAEVDAQVARASEQRIRSIIDSMLALVALVAPDGTLLEVNRAALALANVSPQEVIGQPVVDTPWLSHSADARRLVAEAIGRASAGEVVRQVLTVRDASGRILQVDTVFAPLRTATGRVTEIVASGLDVTERQTVEDQLRSRLRQQEAVAELGSQALRTLDLQFVCDIAVSAVARVLDAPLCKVLELQPGGTALLLRAGVGWQPGLVGHAEVSVGVESQAGFTLLSNAPVIVEDLRDESRFSGPPLLHAHGVISGISVIIPGQDSAFGVLGVHTTRPRRFDTHDVHFLQSVANVLADFVQRGHVAQALTHNERRYRSLITALSQLVWTTDAAGENLTLIGEPALIEQHRRVWREVNGRPVIHPDDAEALRAVWAAARAAKERFEFGYRMQSAAGEWRQVVTTGLPVLDADGRVEEWVGVVRDVTDQRRIQEQLRQSQKVEAVGQFAAGIAHDFNNLLTVIRGCGELVEPLLPAESLARVLFRDIRDAGERATALTRQLLTFSRKEVVSPVVLDVRHAVREAERMLRRIIGEDVKLLVNTGAEPVFVRIDATHMEQVIVNIALNARDAMPKGGTLVIDTRLDGAAHPPDCQPGPYLVLTMTDTGSGMTPEIQARIFEPFFTTKGPGHGTGLGLATAHGIVTQAGGAIGVTSAPGTGTTFTVHLPAVAKPTLHGATLQDASLRRGTETILLVEDESAVRAFMRVVLERSGYTVISAGSGTDGVRMAREHSGPIHLLVSDVILPDIGGRMVADEVCAMRPDIRVLLVSGYNDDALLRHGVARHDVAFLQKPFLPGDLTQRVRDVLDGPLRHSPPGANVSQ